MHSRLLVAIAAVAMLLPLSSAFAFDAAIEAANFAKTAERDRYIVLTPEFQERLNRQHVTDPQRSLAIRTEELAAGADARVFETNICFSRQRECAGDVRFHEWEQVGFGKTEEVLFGARSGATISAKVWATKQGPAKRPGIVITTGSVQAPETLYWGFAATLAKHGYVVLTYDVQGQGQSDTFGEGDDRMEGVPSQAGQPFYDGTEDALDYLLSSPASPYDPRPSCGNANQGLGSDHSDKHERRVALGLNSPHNPFWELVDPGRIGIAGHSLGAGAVSYIGQLDDRVDAIVAWDNLRAPTAEGGRFGAPECPSGSSPRPAELPITKPAIGFSNDYGLMPAPRTSDPDPQGPNSAFAAYKAAGVDAMQVNTRGGTHFEYSFIPGVTVPPLGLATLRGPDMSIWYTTAWFDRYVKCQGDATCAGAAERRLLTDRWRDDARGAAVDPSGDPNVFSFYLRSRYDIGLAGGGRAACDDMRTGCATMGPDGLPPGYDHVADAHTAPSGDSAGPPGPGPGPGGPSCSLPQRGTGEDDSPRTLPPSDAGDAIHGRGGDDRLRGGRGADCLYGGAGDDRLKGGAGRDRLDCGRGRHDRAVVDRADRKPKRCEKVRRRK